LCNASYIETSCKYSRNTAGVLVEIVQTMLTIPQDKELKIVVIGSSGVGKTTWRLDIQDIKFEEKPLEAPEVASFRPLIDFINECHPATAKKKTSFTALKEKFAARYKPLFISETKAFSIKESKLEVINLVGLKNSAIPSGSECHWNDKALAHIGMNSKLPNKLATLAVIIVIEIISRRHKGNFVEDQLLAVQQLTKKAYMFVSAAYYIPDLKKERKEKFSEFFSRIYNTCVLMKQEYSLLDSH